MGFLSLSAYFVALCIKGSLTLWWGKTWEKKMYTIALRVANAYCLCTMGLCIMYLCGVEMPWFEPIWQYFVIGSWTNNPSTEIHEAWGDGLVALTSAPLLVLVYLRAIFQPCTERVQIVPLFDPAE
jgi:hypothetical protein